MFWDFGSLHQKHHVGGTHGRVRRDGSDGSRSPVPQGDNTGGRGRVLPPPTIRCQSRRQVQNILTHLCVDSARDVRLSTSRWVLFLGFVLELRFTLPEAFAASSPTRCRGSRIFLPCRCGDSGFVSRHKPADHHIAMFLHLQTLRRHDCQMVSPISKLTFKVALPPLCCRGNLCSFLMTLFTGRERHHSSSRGGGAWGQCCHSEQFRFRPS